MKKILWLQRGLFQDDTYFRNPILENSGPSIVSKNQRLPLWYLNPQKYPTWVFSLFRYAFMHTFSYRIGLNFMFFKVKCIETF